jgi:hypothetical protein
MEKCSSIALDKLKMVWMDCPTKFCCLPVDQILLIETILSELLGVRFISDISAIFFDVKSIHRLDASLSKPCFAFPV